METGHPSTRAVNSGSGNWALVSKAKPVGVNHLETGLQFSRKYSGLHVTHNGPAVFI